MRKKSLRMTVRAYFLPVLLLISMDAAAAIQTLRISPNAINRQSYQIKGPHIAIWDDSFPTALTGDVKLVINIGGTNSTPEQFLDFAKTAAELGYPALNVDYPNGVISTTCRTISPECFDLYRREIVFGDQVSPIVNVNAANSIYKRIKDLLAYLKNQDPVKWSPFINQAGRVQWNKIILTGHSQGSGHAAYLSKVFRVQGVIAFSGPHDHAEHGPASWIVTPGLTPGNKYFAFLHIKDFFGFDGQLAAMRDLIDGENSSSQSSFQIIDNLDLTQVQTQILASDAVVQDPHNSVLLPDFKEVWKHLIARALL